MIKVDTKLSASTPQSFVFQALKQGKKFLIYNDFSYFTSFLKTYEFGKANGIVVIPSVELFVDSGFNNTITIVAKTQEAFSKLSSFLSNETPITNTVFVGDKHPVWKLCDLKNLVLETDGLFFLITSSPTSILGSRFNNCEKIIDDFYDFYKLNKAFFVLTIQKLTRLYLQTTVIELESGEKFVFPSDYRVGTPESKGMLLKNLPSEKKLPTKIFYVQPTLGDLIKLPNSKPVKIQNKFVGLDIVENGLCVQSIINKKILDNLKKKNINYLVYDCAYYADPSDKDVQNVRLDSENKKQSQDAYMFSYEEIKKYLIENLNFDDNQSEKVINDTKQWEIEQFNKFSLKYETRLVQYGNGNEDVSAYFKNLIKKYDRIPRGPEQKKYIERLKFEIDILSRNGTINLLPYFIPITQVLDYYYDNGLVTGPGRGSAAGSLLLYLCGITHVDPIKYGLSFERFLSLTRILKKDMPDVDVDLPDRTLLVGDDGKSGFLFNNFGKRAAQISTRTLLRLKSAIKDVSRYYHGRVLPEIEELTKKIESAPQGVSDQDFVFGYEDSDGNHHQGLIETSEDLKNYTKKFPEEWEIVKKMLGISRQYSKHASAFVISNEDVSKTVPLFFEGKVTQYEAKEVEKAGLIKYDFLVVNQLKDIQECIQKINKRFNINPKTGFFPKKDGNLTFVWNLEHDIDVYKSVWDGNTATLFQINTDTMRSFVIKLKPQSIEDLAVLLALVRPGPLDYVDPKTNRTMAEEYLVRRNDMSKTKDNIIKPLLDLLPETYGIMVYQEQLTKVAKEIGEMTPEDAEELRRAFAKKQLKKALEMKPIFMKGATKNVGEDLANVIWAQMETSARYSFNKSHAVSYAFITYATMYLRHHYPLEWWASVLENTDESEYTTKLFKYVSHMVEDPTVNANTKGIFIDYEKGKIRLRLSLLKGIGEKVVEKIVSSAPYKNIFDFVERSGAGFGMAKKLLIAGVLEELFNEETSNLYEQATNSKCPDFNTYQNKLKVILAAFLKNKKNKIISPDILILPEEDLKMTEVDIEIEKKNLYPTKKLDLVNLAKKKIEILSKDKNFNVLLKNYPTKHINYHKTISEYSKNSNTYAFKDSAYNEKIKLTYLDENGDLVEEGIEKKYIVPAFIIDHKWFSYKKENLTKKALKLILDYGNENFEELVVWPPKDKNDPESIIKYNGQIKNNNLILLTYSFNGSRSFLDQVFICN